MYFYHKALQQADGKPVDIKDFRYGGTRPSSKESAIVMLADTIEAAVRSMADPTPQAIQRFIERLVRGKIEDGQLSNSPLSLLDIDGICEAFSAVLSGVFHERIEYPTVQLAPDAKAAPAKPVAQTTAPTPVVNAAAQTTAPTPAVKPVAQTTAPTPVVSPAPQATAPAAPVQAEPPAPADDTDDTDPESAAAPAPTVPEQKEDKA